MRYSILGIMFMLYSLTMMIRRLICSAGVVKEVIDEFHFHNETGQDWHILNYSLARETRREDNLARKQLIEPQRPSLTVDRISSGSGRDIRSLRVSVHA